MPESTKTGIPDKLLKEAAARGLSEPLLRQMLVRSVRFSHPLGNRRYKDYLFLVEGGCLLSVLRLSVVATLLASVKDTPVNACRFCDGSGTLTVFDECPRCDGEGCARCDQGLARRTVRCSACAFDKRC